MHNWQHHQGASGLTKSLFDQLKHCSTYFFRPCNERARLAILGVILEPLGMG